MITIYTDSTKTWNTFISNSLNEKDKLQLKIVLEKYNSRLHKYKDIVDKAPPKCSSEEYTNKVIEGTMTKSRGSPKKHYTEEGIEALKQKRDIAKRHYENNSDKKKTSKSRMDKE